MMEEKTPPFFSIIIPMFNVADRISISVKGLVKQTCQDFEVHFVDDKSTDDTVYQLNTLIRKFHERFFVHELTKNVGCGPARNIGVKHARGQYLIFHDADDWLDSEALYFLKEHILDNAMPDVTVYQYTVSDTDKRIKRHANSKLKKMPGEINGLSMFKAICNGDINPSTWNKVFKRSNWQNHELNFLEHFIYEDLAFMPYACLFMNRVTFCNNARYCYYHNPAGITYEMSNRQANAPFDSLNGLKGLLVTLSNYEQIKNDFYKLAFNTFHHNYFYANRMDLFNDEQTLIYSENLVKFCDQNELHVLHILSNSKMLELVQAILIQLRARNLKQNQKAEFKIQDVELLIDHYSILSNQIDLTLEFVGESSPLQNKRIEKVALLEMKMLKLKRKNHKLRSSFIYWIGQYVAYWLKRIIGK